MIKPGQRIDTSFTLKIFADGQVRELRFADLLTRPTIVSVYMKNKTPGCDRQNDSLVTAAREIEAAGYNLIALSRDTCGSHQRYAAEKKITYVLASDPGDQFSKAVDALIEKTMYGRKFIGPARAAYVFDQDGTVLAVAEKVDTANHGAQLRELIKAL